MKPFYLIGCTLFCLAIQSVFAQTTIRIADPTATTIGPYSTMIGVGAGAASTGESNTFLGYQAGFSNVTGANNTYIGSESGIMQLLGFHNTYIGYRSGAKQENGTGNTYIGSGITSVIGYRNGTARGSYNTIVGAEAGNRNQGTGNTILGYQAGNAGVKDNFTGQIERGASFNTQIGYKAGHYLAGGSYNLSIGVMAGFMNTDGFYNIAIGDSALYNCILSDNTALGRKAGFWNIRGMYNLYLGGLAGYNDTGGTRNVIIGYNANVGRYNLTNAVAIGSNAIVSTSDAIVLGDTVAAVKVGIGTTAPRFTLDVRGIINIGGNGTLKFSHLSNSGIHDGMTVTDRFLTVNANGETVLAKQDNSKVDALTKRLEDLEKENRELCLRLERMELDNRMATKKE